MNRSIRKISIIGNGAMGSIYAALFHEMDGGCVSFIAGGERYERLSRDGVVVNGTTWRIPVVRVGEPASPPDLLIVAVKHGHLDDAIRDMKCSVGEETNILSLMNGIESEERIGAVYGMKKVLYTVPVGMDATRVGNRVTYANLGKLLFGEARNIEITERVGRIQSLFDRAGIVHETPRDMLRTLWWKFMINVGVNQVSAVLRAPYGVFRTSPEAGEYMDSAMKEVIALAGEAGIHLSDADLENWRTILFSLSPNGKTSMLQDVEAGRKTEVEMFAGRVIELGKRFGIPTPVNERLLEEIRQIEDLYDR